MTDEKLELDLTRWMKDTEFDPPDARSSARQVATRLPQTRQFGRWRWLPSFQRSTPTHPPNIDQTNDYQPTPIPASNGHSPTALGRTQSMLSPVKAITAGALVFAIGGVLLIAQPFDQQGSSVPGAATDTEFVAPVEVTGTVSGWRSVSPGVDTAEDGFVLREGRRTAMRYAASDSRLSGEVTNTGNWLVYPELDVQVEAGAFELVNADGRWVGTQTTVGGPGIDLPDIIVFSGEEAYDGLTAYIGVDWNTNTLSGLIFTGDMPTFPELAVTE